MKISTGMALIVAAALAASALSACGGGGGKLAPGPSAGSFDLQTGIHGLVASGQSVNVSLSGTVNNAGVSVPFTGSGTLTLSPGVDATFNGVGAQSQSKTISGTVTAAGQTQALTTSVVDYYANGDDAFVGETDPSTGEYDVAQAPFTYPASVVAGSSGTLGTTSNYADSTMAVVLGTTQVSYAVTAQSGSSNSVLVAITDQIYDPQNNLIETDVTNYSLTSSSVLSFTSATANGTIGSLTVTAQ
jgi:hypothetical protein